MNIATTKGIEATSIRINSKQKKTQQVNQADNTNEQTITYRKQLILLLLNMRILS